MDTSASRPEAPTSLYQECLIMIEKLKLLPDIAPLLDVAAASNPSDRQDPVSLLWTVFRQGTALCLLINRLRPNSVPDVSSIRAACTNEKLAKKNIYYFLVAVRDQCGIPESQLFGISDLFKDDTNEFVKVVRTVDIVLNMLQREGRLSAERVNEIRARSSYRLSMDAKTHREKVIEELLETERKYVRDLETLHAYATALVDRNVVSRETHLMIFANLDKLLDFQRRFLIALEETCAKDRRIGALFTQMELDFEVYDHFCENYRKAIDTSIEFMEKLNTMSDVIEPKYGLPSYLIKPVQRICKYPLLLRELIRYTDEKHVQELQELNDGYEAMNRITSQVNESRRRVDNAILAQQLEHSVEDWKGFKMSEFGALLLDAKVMMVRRETEKMLHVFLFERILICCKDLSKEKKKSRLSRKSTTYQYAFKGGVPISRVHSVKMSTDEKTFDVAVFFMDEDSGDIENFVLKFLHDEPQKAWKQQIEHLMELRRRSARMSVRHSKRSVSSNENRDPNHASTIRSVFSDLSEPSPPLSRRPSGNEVDAAANIIAALENARNTTVTPSSPLRSPSARKSLRQNIQTIDENAPLADYARMKPSSRPNAPAPRKSALTNLDTALDELSAALQNGFFEDDDDEISPVLVADVPPPLADSMSNLRSVANSLAPPSHPPPHPASSRTTSMPAVSPRSASLPKSSASASELIKVRLHADGNVINVYVTGDATLSDLTHKVASVVFDGVNLPQKEAEIKMRYQDEDGDYIMLRTDDDVRVAVQLAKSSSNGKAVMNLFVS